MMITIGKTCDLRWTPPAAEEEGEEVRGRGRKEG